MALPEKPILTLTAEFDAAETTIEPFELDCARCWAWIAGGCVFATLIFSFIPDAWARAGCVIASMVAAIAIVAIVYLFHDYAYRRPFAREEEDDDC